MKGESSPTRKPVAAESAIAEPVVIFIPDDILDDILSRLPSKSLLRFSAVAKSWYSLFKSPNFIATHLNRSSSCCNSKLLIFPCNSNYGTSGKTCSLLSQETLSKNNKLDFTWTPNPCKTLILSSESCFSNGLICLKSAYRSHVLHLCNPSMRRVKELPPTCHFTTPADTYYKKAFTFHSFFGFAFDGVSCDYKVVRFFHHSVLWNVAPKAEVYSLKTNSWKSVELNVSQEVANYMGFSSASCNGGIHWLAAAVLSRPSVILCFDIHKEVFSEMVFPLRLSVYRKGFAFLFKGLLSVFIETLYHDNDFHYEVWVMKEYGVAESWTKQFTGMLPGPYQFEAALTKAGKVILHKPDGFLALLDLENSRLQDLAFEKSLYVVCDYMESLVFLDGGVSSVADSVN